MPISLPIHLGSLWNFKLKLLTYQLIIPTCLILVVQIIKKFLYLCQFNSDLYEMLNLNCWGTKLLIQLTDIFYKLRLILIFKKTSTTHQPPTHWWLFSQLYHIGSSSNFQDISNMVSKIIQDVKDDPILQVVSQEPSTSSKSPTPSNHVWSPSNFQDIYNMIWNTI